MIEKQDAPKVEVDPEKVRKQAVYRAAADVAWRDARRVLLTRVLPIGAAALLVAGFLFGVSYSTPTPPTEQVVRVPAPAPVVAPPPPAPAAYTPPAYTPPQPPQRAFNPADCMKSGMMFSYDENRCVPAPRNDKAAQDGYDYSQVQRNIRPPAPRPQAQECPADTVWSPAFGGVCAPCAPGSHVVHFASGDQCVSIR